MNKELIIKKLRFYNIIFYLLLAYGQFLIFLGEINVHLAMGYELNSFVDDIWQSLSRAHQLYGVIFFYITLHILVTAILNLLKKYRLKK